MSEQHPSCLLLLSSVKSPESIIFGVLLIIIAFVACCENTISLVILWQPNIRSQSNKLLTSLVVADALVGYVQLPITTWQLFTQTEHDCILEGVRAFCIVSLTGASTLAIAFIAYDRYILLTGQNGEYERRMCNKKVYIMIAINWFIPMASVCLRYVYFKSYMYTLFTMSVLPLIVMTVAYFIIARKIRKNEEELRNCYLREQTLPESELRLKRGTKMAKVAVSLIVVYFLSSLPTSVYFIIYLRNASADDQSFFQPYHMQVYYLCALVVFSLNSCINPIIYASKYPEFKTILRSALRKYELKLFRSWIS